MAEFVGVTTHVPALDDDDARATLDGAVRLWRGDPLAEFAHEEWAEAEVAHLNEQHAIAVGDLAVLQLDALETSTALIALHELVERHPYSDRPRALLMRALVDAGRQTDALRAFHDYRAVLRDEVGTEPADAVIELDRAIATFAESQAPLPPPRPDHPAWVRTRRRPSIESSRPTRGLPVPLSSFVGRRDDLITVSLLLEQNRLVTLTGAGGCGKTRLALAAATDAAESSPTTTWWAELALVSNPDHVVEHVAAAVGSGPQPGLDPMQRLVEHLGVDRPMLLVLDNAEHLLGPIVGLLSELLPRCPFLRVLVTSREPLGIAGEAVWRVPSLATPSTQVAEEVDQVDDVSGYDAVQLFLERARAARPGIVVDVGAIRHVTSICIGVDGLPLAIELAAARTRALPLEVVARGIGDAVRWQTSAARAPLARHATLHASIAWSLDLIDPLARSVLTRLAVFQSSFTVDAALAVGGAGEPAEALASALGALVDANLLQFDDTTGRYRMLLTIRQFCTLRAQASGELDQARGRHAEHFAAYCVEVGEGVHGIERGPFIAEMPDLVAAMAWARDHAPRLAFEMCAGLASVRSALGHHSNLVETWSWLLSLDRGAEGDDGWSAEWAAAVAATMAAATAHWLDVGAVVDEVSRLLPTDARRARGWLARGAAMVPAYRGHVGPILAHIEEARERGDDLELSIYGGFAAYMLALMGRIDESRRQVDELARLARRQRTTFGVDTVGNGYAAAVICDMVRGDLRTATGRASTTIPDDPAFSMTAAAALAHLASITGDPHTLQCAQSWSRRGTIPLLRFLPTFIELVGRQLDGETEAAADLAEQYWDEATPVPVSRLHPLPILAGALVDAERMSVAATMTQTAADLVPTMEPAPLLEAGVLASRALLAARTGDGGDVVPLVRALLELTTVHGFVPMTMDALELVVSVTVEIDLAALDDTVSSARLWLSNAGPTIELGADARL